MVLLEHKDLSVLLVHRDRKDKKEHKDIKVKPTFVSYEALHDKIVTSAPAGTYDVVLVDVIWPAEFASKGIVADITDRIPDSWKSDMLPAVLATAEYKGKYYGNYKKQNFRANPNAKYTGEDYPNKK